MAEDDFQTHARDGRREKTLGLRTGKAPPQTWLSLALLIFADGIAEFLVHQPKRRQRQILSLTRKLAEHPLIRSDYRIADDSGREIDHLLIDGYVFACWLDHAVREIRITDIEDAS